MNNMLVYKISEDPRMVDIEHRCYSIDMITEIVARISN